MNRYLSNQQLTELLVGRRIVATQMHDGNGALMLDDRTVLVVEGNEGCGGCSSGWFYVTQLAQVDNIITDVRFEYDEDDKAWDDDSDDRMSIYVIAEGIPGETEIVRVDGGYGNGYYGGGYRVYVRDFLPPCPKCGSLLTEQKMSGLICGDCRTVLST